LRNCCSAIVSNCRAAVEQHFGDCSPSVGQQMSSYSVTASIQNNGFILGDSETADQHADQQCRRDLSDEITATCCPAVARLFCIEYIIPPRYTQRPILFMVY
jgi:hypothetical protein